MIFISLGVSFRTAPLELRERVRLDGEAGRRFRAEAAARGVRQIVTLSTCNRTEVFFWGGAGSLEKVRSLFLSAFPAEGLDAALEVFTGLAALVRLCRIAAGFESMVLGEYQILGQVKEAYSEAQATGHVGRELDRIFREAITCAKRIRTELDLGAVPPSVCRAGMDALEARGGVAGKRVFVIGSGRTGSLAVKLAVERKAREIVVCNRSRERVEKLVRRFGTGVADYEARYEEIARSDVVISATASPHVVVRADALRLVRPVLVLDLAVPRDVDPAVAENPLVTLVGIEELGELAAGDRAERERIMAVGMQIVDATVAALAEWLALPVPSRTISAANAACRASRLHVRL